MKKIAAILVALLPSLSFAVPATLPSLTVPDGLGVNIHFTDAKPGEMEMLAAAGFKWVRMDFGWGGTEGKAGEYDFSAYDRLMAALDRHGIRPVFILDYSNKLYDSGLSPSSDAGRAAFARWAAAARHFAGRGVVWEMYNEPNIGFWKPKPDVEAYAALALSVGKALRDAAPDELYVGPATSTIDLKFLEACFKAGCLEYWSAVSVHPYRQSNPESAAVEYRQLRLLISRYAPKGRAIPILSGEWGYSAGWQKFDEEKQGRYLPRELLTNLWQEVPISIWYDWHDDGTDAREPEHHFGTVHNAYRQGDAEVFEAKPAYRAMKTLAAQLGGYRYSKRLMLDDPRDFCLLFDKPGGEAKVVAWTTADEPRKVLLPASAGEFEVTNHLGDSKGKLVATEFGLAATLTGEVTYFTATGPNPVLSVAAHWTRVPLELTGSNVCFSNSASVQSATGLRTAGGSTMVPIARSAEPRVLSVVCPLKPFEQLRQQVLLSSDRPLFLSLLPVAGGKLIVRLRDPSAEGLKGKVTLVGIEALDVDEVTQSVLLKPGQTEATVLFPAKVEGADYSVGVQLTDDSGQMLVELPQQNFGGLPDLATEGAFRLFTDGDAKVKSEQSLTRDVPLEAAPVPGIGVLKLAYKCDPGWKFWRIAPANEEIRKISGEPKALGLWIWGDGKGGLPRLRFTDSTGQTFQPSGQTIDWKGWKYVTIPMDQAAVAHSHWGGGNDGVIHYPIKWDTIFLLDRDAKQPAEGAVYIAGGTIIR